MSFIDRVMGASPEVLTLRAQRSELISANLANADTPGYKARDVDFQRALSAARSSQSGGISLKGSQATLPHSNLSRTNARHFATADAPSSAHSGYRVPAQPSLDGNTVETQREHALFMENALRYEASLNFLDQRIKSTVSVLRGE